MKRIESEYKRWLEFEHMSEKLRRELEAMSGEEIKHSFYRDLEFGTSGLRGLMGAGINKMNNFVVRKVTRGLANYINSTCRNGSCVIGYDTRNNSREFACETARTLCENGIKVFMFKDASPVPELSFMIRKLKATFGVEITASHNKKEYNGYKVYSSSGYQITETIADKVLYEIKKIDVLSRGNSIDLSEFERDGLLKYISEEAENEYIRAVIDETKVVSQSITKEQLDNIKVVYTPLNGTGRKYCAEVLKGCGISDYHIVESQMNPDGNFTTCPYPNPEKAAVYEEAWKICREIDADIIVVTDPDSDRLGLAINRNGQLDIFNGNEIGIILFNFICRMRSETGNMPHNPVTFKSLVSTGMIDIIAEKYGVQVKRKLTGFKYIGEELAEMEEKGTLDDFIFGFEESHGYLTGPHSFDKDGLNGLSFAVLAAAWYKGQGKTLRDALDDIYREFCYYETFNMSFEVEDSFPDRKIKRAMEVVESDYRRVFGDFDITDYITYSGGKIKHIKCRNADIIFRPSGTEPKLKVYIFSYSQDKDFVMKQIEKIKATVETAFNSIFQENQV